MGTHAVVGTRKRPRLAQSQDLGWWRCSVSQPVPKLGAVSPPQAHRSALGTPNQAGWVAAAPHPHGTGWQSPWGSLLHVLGILGSLTDRC